MIPSALFLTISKHLMIFFQFLLNLAVMNFLFFLLIPSLGQDQVQTDCYDRRQHNRRFSEMVVTHAGSVASAALAWETPTPSAAARPTMEELR